MVSFTLTFDKDVLEAVRSRILNRPNAVQIYMEKTVPTLVRRKLSPILKEPRPPDLPFVWSYDPVKQRRAQRWYFANKAKGRIGGRHVRTHALVNNWKVAAAKIRNGAILTISNDTPGLDYVQGPRQVPSHRDSGWAQYDDVLLAAEKYANDLVIDFWLRTEI
jgi:hypothetical protein